MIPKLKVWDKVARQWLSDGLMNQMVIIVDGALFVPANYVIVFFTGLPDKDITDIYAGDILKISFEVDTGDDSYCGYHIGVVGIRPSMGVIINCVTTYDESDANNIVKSKGCVKMVRSYRSKVIGNIYEHPELLETTDAK